jgi:tRNA threonylcarbamoyl adenosine modification protein YeaZ
MKILAIEFSSSERSVAVLEDNGAGEPSRVAQVSESGLSTTNAFGMIDRALDEAGVEREQIEQIAVGLGPGSFTGVRAAIAIAQGWNLASQINLQGVNSAEALACRAQAEGCTGRISVITDAQRKEFYAADVNLDSADPIAPLDLRIVTRDELLIRESQGALLVGPEIQKWFPSGKELYPDALHIGLLAMTRRNFVRGKELEPVYPRETAFIKAPAPREIPPVGADSKG